MCHAGLDSCDDDIERVLPPTEQLLETGGDLAPDALGTGVTADSTSGPRSPPDGIETGTSTANTTGAASSAAGATAQKTVVRFLADYPGFEKIGTERAVKLIFSLDSRKATERMRRVMHALKAGTKVATGSGGRESRATTGLMIDIDPVLVMIKCDDGVSCVVIMPSSFKTADGSHVTELPLGALKGPSTLVTGRVLLVKSAEADLVADDEFLTLSSTSIGEELVSPGPFTSPFSPDCAGDEGGFPVWRVSVKDTACALDVAWGALAAGSTLRARMAKPASERSLYKGMDGTPAFIATGTESRTLVMDAPATAQRASQQSSAPQTVTCEICGEDWPAKEMRLHVGAHQLLNPPADWNENPSQTWPNGKPRPKFPCMMCGVRPAMQRTQDAVDGCPMWLDKPAQTDKPHCACKLTGDFDYSLKPASNSNRSAPCTNVPVACPRCPAQPAKFVVCSYQLELHWQERHQGFDMPAELQAKAKLGVHEREWVAIAGVERCKAIPKCKIAGCECRGK